MALFTTAEARAWDKKQLEDKSAYPDATITATEAAIRAQFERIIGVALATTSTIEVLDGSGSDTLQLAHHNPYAEANQRAVSVTACVIVDNDGVTYETFDADDLSDLACYPSGKIIRRTNGAFLSGLRNVTVTYTHGYTTAPVEIQRAALAVCVRRLVPSNIPLEASAGTEHGIDWSRMPDIKRERWTGINWVDATLNEHRSNETIGIF